MKQNAKRSPLKIKIVNALKDVSLFYPRRITETTTVLEVEIWLRSFWQLLF